MSHIMTIGKKVLGSIVRAYSSEKVLKIEWAFLGIISVTSFFIFHYYDLDSLTIWSVYLLDAVYDKNFFEFYKYASQYGLVGCDVFPFIPWAIWNIPIWIAQRFYHVPIRADSIYPILWSKLFLVILLFVTARYAYKIGMLLTLDRNRSIWMGFLTLSSIYSFIGIYYTGQNCILSIMFSVIAIHALLKGKEWAFLILSACSIAAKPFFAFAFIAIILLCEKNILKVFLKLLSGASILILCKVLFWNAPMYQESMKNSSIEVTLASLFETGINMQFGSASFFAIALIIICYLCYAKNTVAKSPQRNYFIIYSVTAIYSLLFLFGKATFYRPIYLIPFLPILLLSNKRTIKINLIIEPIVSFLRVVMFCSAYMYMSSSKYIFTTWNMVHTVLAQLFPEVWRLQRPVMSFEPLINSLLPQFMYTVVNAVIIVGTLLILIINYPGIKVMVPFENEKCARWIMWCNAFLFVPFLIGILYNYFNVIR